MSTSPSSGHHFIQTVNISASILPNTLQSKTRFRIALVLARRVRVRLDFLLDGQIGPVVELGALCGLECVTNPRGLGDPAIRPNTILEHVCWGYSKVMPDSGLVPCPGEALGSITDRVDDGDLSTDTLAFW